MSARYQILSVIAYHTIPLFLIFVGRIVLLNIRLWGPVLSSNTLNMSSHCLWPFIISDEKSAVSLTGFPYIKRHLSTAFKIFFFSLLHFYHMSDVDLFYLFYLEFVECLGCVNSCFSSYLEIFRHHFFK